MRISLDLVARNSHETAERHEILDRVEDGRTGHDPADWGAERIARDMRLALAIADLVTLIQDDAIPLYGKQRTRGRSDTRRQDRVWRDDHVRQCSRQGALGAVKRVNLQTGCEPANLSAPLAHNRLGHHYEGTRLGVNEHSRNKLDRLTQAHFVTQEPPRVGRRGLAAYEPAQTLVLVRGNQAGTEHGLTLG